jgi:hypothetical protein
VPQFNFEVVRPARRGDGVPDLSRGSCAAVALMPGTGEYALATTPVHYRYVGARAEPDGQCQHAPRGETDLDRVAGALRARCRMPVGVADRVVVRRRPALRRLRGAAQGRAEAFMTAGDALAVRGLERAEAERSRRLDGRPVYGGTPAMPR